MHGTSAYVAAKVWAFSCRASLGLLQWGEKAMHGLAWQQYESI